MTSVGSALGSAEGSLWNSEPVSFSAVHTSFTGSYSHAVLVPGVTRYPGALGERPPSPGQSGTRPPPSPSGGVLDVLSAPTSMCGPAGMLRGA